MKPAGEWRGVGDFLHPLGRNFTIRCAHGFVEQATKLLGSVELWDEVQENFDVNLARDPYFGQYVVADLYGLTIVGPLGTITVGYRIIEGEGIVELVEAVIA